MKTQTVSVCVLLLLCTFPASGQLDSDNHTVRVRVRQITALEINVGSVMMTIDGSGLVAGQDSMVVSDQSTSLLWGTNSSNIKTTISSNLLAPRFALHASASNATTGTSAGDVRLSTTPVDFLLDMGRSSGTCQILYTGVATASQGTGTDIHVITITVQSQ